MLFDKRRGHITDSRLRIFHCRYFWFSRRYQKLSNTDTKGRSRWPRGLSRRSAAARLLVLRVRIPPGAWMSACCECCVLSGRYLCVRLITRPEESCRVWCVWVWSWSPDNEEALAHWGLLRHEKKLRLQYAEENIGRWETHCSRKQSEITHTLWVSYGQIS